MHLEVLIPHRLLAAILHIYFDYKFSNDTAEHALETYGPQLAAYQEAVEALHPGAAVSASLVLIGESIQVVGLS